MERRWSQIEHRVVQVGALRIRLKRRGVEIERQRSKIGLNVDAKSKHVSEDRFSENRSIDVVLFIRQVSAAVVRLLGGSSVAFGSSSVAFGVSSVAPGSSSVAGQEGQVGASRGKQEQGGTIRGVSANRGK